ncbi:MAG TPA: EAL domain-containing protein [Candidatus Angelobacter sp.]|jgi:diguanylate cyclase (GGDEF)-like protein/PAS domain S-box-containing protein|nr:EAL domain-containing protein [Candidatus Angelobacter sp.]
MHAPGGDEPVIVSGRVASRNAVRPDGFDTRWEGLGRLLLDSSGEGIYGIDRAGICRFVNKSAEQLLGAEPGELIGTQMHARMHHTRSDGSLRANDGCAIHRALRRAGTVRVDEDVFWRSDGTALPVAYSASPMLEGDEVIGAVVTFTDISERLHITEQLRENQERLRISLDASQTMTWDLDLMSARLRLSDNGTELLGLGSGRLPRTLHAFMDMVHPGDRPAMLRALQEPTIDVEYRVITPTGDTRWLHSRARTIRDPAGNSVSVLGVAVDITSRMAAQRQRDDVEDALRSTIVLATDAFIGMDEAGLITAWNPAAERMFGWTSAEVEGRSLVDTIIPKQHRSAHRRGVARFLADPDGHSTLGPPRELSGLHRDGHKFPAELSISAVNVRGRFAFMGFVRDITERVAAADQLRKLALEDPLTALPTRALLVDRLASALARRGRSNQELAVFFIDLDHFKSVNDSLGHATGDRVLKTIAERLRGAVRPGDTVARFGGDEFVILCEDMGSEAVLALADRLGSIIALPVHMGAQGTVVTASIGVALAPRAAVEPESLIRDADAAMYRAKDRGRARCEIFDAGTRNRAQARQLEEVELRRAVDAGELVVHYQPVLDIGGDTVAGAEALVRWQHPTRGLVAPDDFIPLAEKVGLVVPIGAWVLETALKEAATWPVAGSGAPLHVAVNISAIQLNDPHLPDLVARAIETAGVDPGNVVLEITESAVMADARASARMLAQLRHLGVRLAIDDFGTGYSSLLYLRQFAVDTLKIDRFFVNGLGRSADDTAIVRSIIRLAAELELTTVAEGTETREQREQLAELGCGLAQGFLWSRALAAADFREWLAAGPPWQPAITLAGIQQPRPAGRVQPPSANAARDHVVLIDDDVPDREMLRIQLEATGRFAVVGEAGDGESGIAMATALNPELVIVDLALPTTDGIAVTAALNQAAPRACIVVRSGFISEGLRKSALAEGAAECFAKSVPYDRLVTDLMLLRGIPA